MGSTNQIRPFQIGPARGHRLEAVPGVPAFGDWRSSSASLPNRGRTSSGSAASGVKLMPHQHPEDRVYTVISGVFDGWNRSTRRCRLPPGASCAPRRTPISTGESGPTSPRYGYRTGLNTRPVDHGRAGLRRASVIEATKEAVIHAIRHQTRRHLPRLRPAGPHRHGAQAQRAPGRRPADPHTGAGQLLSEGAPAAPGARCELSEGRRRLHPDRHDLDRRPPHDARVPRLSRRPMDLPLRSRLGRFRRTSTSRSTPTPSTTR